ncbi:PREDICTED: integrin beta-PS-like isoform X2 [Nicrophorus vespilloides]|uniref:Integrin beta n=1 Tax=Nicrophorus vespilloides TaxID=110193 RepID=A0ABM1M5V3_NICVS|nr:PREDICTED: integrin beta-PS-like isoform X2 [Nicrophorus vespilloides]
MYRIRMQLIRNIILFLSFVIIGNAQVPEKLTQNPCIAKSNCHDCIQTPSCAWCYKPDFGERARCFQPSNPGSKSCPEEYVWNPDNVLQVLIARELSKAHAAVGSAGGTMESGWSVEGSSSHSSSGSSSWSSHSHGSSSSSGGGFGESNIVQISPQKVNLKLRARQSYSFQMHYTQAEDYPVDLYYLMDLSKSMEDDKDKLSLLGNLLAESMRNITSNFRLGFGSFVDKVVMPYVSTVPKNLREPCTGCAAPYGYRHAMRLDTDTNRFSTMVKEAAVSGNLDAPEGGFDAIMQAVVCRDEIGWREQARRLLVFSTDAGFHYAGDGKLGGIVKPNDGMCHLENGLYTHSSLQDYPSISQINLKVKQNAINLIFAVTEEQIGVYKKLQENIEGAFSGQLSNDSSNIVDLVKEQYQQISSTVEMKDNASNNIKINYYSQCLDESGGDKKTNKCGNIKVGDVITFRVEIEVTQCPKDPKDWKQTLQIYPVGLNESLTIDLEMLCSCPCEHPGHAGYIEQADECRGFGTFKCGICECDHSHFGRYCECSASEMENIKNTLGCRVDNSSTVDCSGRGSCVCGRCECNVRSNEEEKVYGNFCECDNFSCDRHEGKICSGHGTCECGVCQCEEPWGGAACDCRMSNETCFAPGVLDGEICSGHGECKCGSCKCESTEEGRYSGRYCEKCPTCSDRCEEFKHCVQCQMYKTGPLNEEECAKNCTKFTPIGVEQVEAKEENDENLCAFYDEDDCRFAYVYYFDEHNKVVVKAQQERECPAKVFLLGIVLGVIAAIVFMGLAILLLWKLLTTIHDRREFAKFEKERMMAKWDTGENPIYRQATSTFKNPTYAGKG